MNPTSSRSLRRIAPVRPVLLAAALFATSVAAAGNAWDSLVDAERGFARMALERGVKPAFVENLAADAVVFRPGPINGARLWKSRPEFPGILAWGPSFAEVSGSGDFGFTTGPWSYSAGKDSAASGFGEFITVWRRQGDGPWRVALDTGISHDDPGVAPDRVEVDHGPEHPRPDSALWRKWDVGVGVRSGHVGVGTGGVGIGMGSGGLGFGLGTAGARSRRDYEWQRTAHEKNTLLSAERTFAFNAKRDGWERAYRDAAAGDLRVLREGARPDRGVEAAIESRGSLSPVREWLPRGNGIAPSWDLGYVHGLAVASVRGARPETTVYVHFWRKDDAGAWRMLLDFENPFPRAR